MVKILHVNYADISGGAAIGVTRLHKALLNEGIESKILVSEKKGNGENVFGPNKTFQVLINIFKTSLARYLKKRLIKTKNSETFSFNLFNTNLLKKINQDKSDIVHLHWLGNEMISISQIKKINKPIIWTFWDMWPMCGAEHHSYDKRFETGYFKNNRPTDERGLDVNKYVWNKKKKHLNFYFKIISLSKWFHNEIKKSSLYANRDVYQIPLHINCNEWKPRDKFLARENFNLPKNKKILLFGSATATNQRKGFDFLIDVFKKHKFENTKLIIFGEKPKNIEKLNIEYEYINRVSDVQSLNLLYSAADLLLMPSLIEVFGQIGLESIACQTPCVVFDNTGLTEFIHHKENGYVSSYKNVEDFANGIKWCLEDDKKLLELGLNSRKIALRDFEDRVVIKKYIKLYEKTISNL